ncbi:MAG: hypothetical protein KAR40_07070 [Candidatus Sabulitectum sp.]|nr:hypothetical protein [Candidatus Sabulitectum sp.]
MRRALTPVIIIVLLAVTGCRRSRNLILIENNSDMICTSVTIAVCDSSWTIQNMAPGEQREFSVIYTKDDAFHVSMEPADGRSLEGSFGYVTHGITGDRIRISIEDDSIFFMQNGNSY